MFEVYGLYSVLMAKDIFEDKQNIMPERKKTECQSFWSTVWFMAFKLLLDLKKKECKIYQVTVISLLLT